MGLSGRVLSALSSGRLGVEEATLTLSLLQQINPVCGEEVVCLTEKGCVTLDLLLLLKSLPPHSLGEEAAYILQMLHQDKLNGQQATMLLQALTGRKLSQGKGAVEALSEEGEGTTEELDVSAGQANRSLAEGFQREVIAGEDEDEDELEDRYKGLTALLADADDHLRELDDSLEEAAGSLREARRILEKSRTHSPLLRQRFGAGLESRLHNQLRKLKDRQLVLERRLWQSLEHREALSGAMLAELRRGLDSQAVKFQWEAEEALRLVGDHLRSGANPITIEQSWQEAFAATVKHWRRSASEARSLLQEVSCQHEDWGGDPEATAERLEEWAEEMQDLWEDIGSEVEDLVSELSDFDCEQEEAREEAEEALGEAEECLQEAEETLAQIADLLLKASQVANQAVVNRQMRRKIETQRARLTRLRQKMVAKQRRFLSIQSDLRSTESRLTTSPMPLPVDRAPLATQQPATSGGLAERSVPGTTLSLPLQQADKIIIRHAFGPVTVEPSPTAELEITATEQLETTCRQQAGEVVFVTHRQDGGCVDKSPLLVKVPAGHRLEIRHAAAPLTISDLAADIVAETANGDILLTACNGALDLTCLNGDIRLLDCRPEALRVSNNNGRVDLALLGLCEAGNMVRTIVGDIHLSWPAESGLNLDLRSRAGVVDCELPLSGHSTAEDSSFSGTHLFGAYRESDSPRLSLETTSGRISVRSR